MRRLNIRDKISTRIKQLTKGGMDFQEAHNQAWKEINDLQAKENTEQERKEAEQTEKSLVRQKAKDIKRLCAKLKKLGLYDMVIAEQVAEYIVENYEEKK